MEAPTQTFDIDVRAYFATPVIFVELEDPEKLNLELRQTILERRSTNISASESTQNTWRSGWDFASWGGEPSRRLLETFAAIGNDMTQTRLNENQAQSTEIKWNLSSQAVVNPCGENNQLYAHPNCFWSGVYFVDDGGNTNDHPVVNELELLDPRGLAPIMYNSNLRMNIPGGENAGAYHQIKPKSGLMVIFPSWLMHRVNSYQGTSTCISIAINLFVSN
jgi:uncharacterized protein (TIGR02466 family)